MGAWGSGPFDNDDASDWVEALEEAADFETVRQALNVEHTAYLEAPEGSIALAAAEVVAAAIGRPRMSLPDSVTTWIESHRSSVSEADTGLALTAVSRVVGDRSELPELWDGDTEWSGEIANLQERLNQRLAP
jgi:hypothetical protein